MARTCCGWDNRAEPASFALGERHDTLGSPLLVAIPATAGERFDLVLVKAVRGWPALQFNRNAQTVPGPAQDRLLRHALGREFAEIFGPLGRQRPLAMPTNDAPILEECLEHGVHLLLVEGTTMTDGIML